MDEPSLTSKLTCGVSDSSKCSTATGLSVLSVALRLVRENITSKNTTKIQTCHELGTWVVMPPILRTTSHTTAVAVAASVEECERDRKGWPTRQHFSSVEILHALLNNLSALSCSDRRCRLFDGILTNCCVAHVLLAWLRWIRLCSPIHPIRGKIIKSSQSLFSQFLFRSYWTQR